MGHLPNFDNTKVYALMNGTDGKFLQYDLNDGSIGVADYEDDTTSEWKTNFYEVEVVDQDPLTIVLTTRLSLFADVGIEALSLNGSHDNVEFTEKKAGTHKKQQWVISTHKSGSGAHELVSIYSLDWFLVC